VTGGCGFIGSNFISFLLDEKKGYQVIDIDMLTYAGNINNLKEYWKDPRLIFYKTDISNENALNDIFKQNDVDIVVNFAAESHVDRSIESPAVFLNTNIFGTFNLIKLSREYSVDRYLQVSTDEVYGSLGERDPAFTEESRLVPNNPYAASKASADLIVHSFIHTYQFPAVITRCSNNYGPCQFPEKLIPVVISNALKDQKIPVYGEGKNVRDWIHVRDHCAGILSALERGKNGEVYNFGGSSEVANFALVKMILQILDKPESLVSFVKDRAGHDFRYAMNYSKAMKELDWKPQITFERGLNETVKWYVENRAWIEDILSGRYKKQNEDFSSKHRIISSGKIV
jgi:dTDP-glucose 4,6-dehydratase